MMLKNEKTSETLADLIIDFQGKDSSKLLIKLAARLDKRLDAGTSNMQDLRNDIAEINALIKELPCKIPVSAECNSKKGSGFIIGVLTTITVIGAGTFTAFETAKPYMKSIIKFVSTIKGAN